MKTYKLHNLLAGALLLFAMPSCQEDANDWGFDEEHNRLFRSTNFELVKEEPTSVLLSFKGVTDATKYIFDFSQGDSLLFDNIVSTRELLADTMTAYRPDVSPVNTEYRMLFDNLNGTTRYSVRMKAVNEEKGMESGYSQLFFITPDEQIFIKVTPGTTIASLKWQADKEATTIKYAKLEGETKVDTTWFEPHTLSSAEKAAGSWTIEGLDRGTNYIAQIFNNDVRRGVYRFTTLGAKGGTLIEVQPSDDINLLLESATGDVTLSFTGGVTYAIRGLVVPDAIDNLYLSGNMVDGVLPTLKINNVGFAGPVENFCVQYMDYEGDGAGFMMMLGGVNGFKNAVFEGCYIHEINNCLVYASSQELDIESIVVKDCILQRLSTSGWGIFNCNTRTFDKLEVTNCTVLDIGDQMVDISVSIGDVQFTNITFCNYVSSMSKWLRFNKQPKGITVTGVIFAGDLGGSKMNSGWGDYSGWLNFAGCYITSDFTVNSKKFNDAKILDITTDELFVDPKNGDFHFRPEVKFEGDGKVGDPRWWTE